MLWTLHELHFHALFNQNIWCLLAVYESRPSLHRYVETRDGKVVLQFLANLYPPSKLTLRELTLELVMLVTLVSGQRGQFIHLLDILNCMTQTETTWQLCSFLVTHNVKQSKTGTKQHAIKLEAYSLLSWSRTALVQLLHLVPDEMKSHWRTSWLLLDGKVTVYLQNITISHSKANPSLKECSHTCKDLYWPLINTAFVYQCLSVDRFIQYNI